MVIKSFKMAKGKAPEDTPLIKQFFSVKAQHPEAVLLYRVGDFLTFRKDPKLTDYFHSLNGCLRK